MNSGWSNVKLRGQIIEGWSKESTKTRIKWLGVKIREISCFQNQQKFEPNLGENDEQNDFKHKINFLNLIKTQITVRWSIESHC